MVHGHAVREWLGWGSARAPFKGGWLGGFGGGGVAGCPRPSGAEFFGAPKAPKKIWPNLLGGREGDTPVVATC